MEQEFELIAKTFMGLEPVLAEELTQLGANNVQIGRRMVSFTGDKEMMYRANFQLHTAIRILNLSSTSRHVLPKRCTTRFRRSITDGCTEQIQLSVQLVMAYFTG